VANTSADSICYRFCLFALECLTRELSIIYTDTYSFRKLDFYFNAVYQNRTLRIDAPFAIYMQPGLEVPG
jgi:hypothetical protein